MLGGELGVEQSEAALPQTLDEMDEANLGGVRAAGEHALAEERRTERDAVKPADQSVALPCLDGMRMADMVQGEIKRTDRLVDPGARPTACLLGAGRDHALEIRIEANVEGILADLLSEALGYVERIQRDDAPQFRLDPEDLRVIGRFRHREEPDGIGAQQNLRSNAGMSAARSWHGLGRGLGQVVFQPMDIVIAIGDILIGNQILEQRQGGLDAVDDEFVERAAQAHHAFDAGPAMHDQLADQAVVVGRDPIALIGAGIDAHAKAAGRMEMCDRAGRRNEGACVFGIDAAFDGVAMEMHFILRHRKTAAGGDTDLLVHKVDAGNGFRDRMLHLQAGVHFDKIELAVFIEELDGAGAAILQLLHGVGADLADLHALLDVECWRICLFPDLLVAALQRAVALAEMDRIAFAVAEHLDFDVTRLAEILFHVDGFVAESGARFRASRRPGFDQVLFGAGDLHAAAAAAGGCLDEHGIADLACGPQRIRLGLHLAVGAGNDRNAELLRRCLGGDLVAHDADMLRRRPDEGDAVRLENIGELRIFRKETVAWMHGVGAGDFAGGDDLVDVEIAFARLRRADANALIRKPHVHRVRVGGRVHRNARNAELLAGAQHAQGDLSAIGYENLRNHGHGLTR
ncbi:hypothetical protein RHSP_16060 [Rhizobium freirei PRF 81]|uniref:Uncharacterized protein n=1 Tax=Rhizobium freirei PRF 81 TaxID=363754 RepID=N6UWC7_9HYPH|nr:hypothetical protein RHSP_16060 [Rhizobium freirei PRF 81]